MKRWIVLCVALLTLWSALAAQEPAQLPAPAHGSTVIVLRHAEKDAQGDPKDPGLSAAGRTRAEALARLLAPGKPTRLFASEFQRAQRTLDPLAQALGLKVEVVPANKGAELAQTLRALPEGSVSVVVAHSNTVPALVAALGGKIERLEKGNLAETEFGRLFVLTLPPEGSAGRVATSTLELAYGN
jgi:broad specificity phosphatase PhoE